MKPQTMTLQEAAEVLDEAALSWMRGEEFPRHTERHTRIQAARAVVLGAVALQRPQTTRPPLPPPREIREGDVPVRAERPRLSPETPRALRCLLGMHDWRRRERYEWFHISTIHRRFEQCRRCDRTREGWSYNERLDAVPPPAPMPWDEGEG